jgi:ACT domain-containing protein
MTDFVIDLPSDSSNHSLNSSDGDGIGDVSLQENRYPLRVLLIGSETDVRETIKNLHHRGFAEATLWSRIMTYPNREAVDHLLPVRTDSVVSILTKYLNH